VLGSIPTESVFGVEDLSWKRPPAWQAAPMPDYVRTPVAAPPAIVVQQLSAALAERGITEYAVVDHGHDMAAAGAPAFEAWTLIFGSPAAGAQILARDLAAAADLPLRLAVIAAEGGGSEIVLRDMATLLHGEAAPLADQFTAVLRGLAEHVRERLASCSDS
jgi:uncharacterized protein (DUF302 family)